MNKKLLLISLIFALFILNLILDSYLAFSHVEVYKSQKALSHQTTILYNLDIQYLNKRAKNNLISEDVYFSSSNPLIIISKKGQEVYNTIDE